MKKIRSPLALGAPPIHRRCLIPITLALLLTALGSLRAESDPRAREILARYAASVVFVQAVSELSATANVGEKVESMPDKDVPVQGVATVVKSDGVLVSALSFFDPSAMMDGRTINGPKGQRAKLDVTLGEIKEVAVVLTDGARISAEVLLKDPALDLIVLRADVEAWRASGGDDLPVIDLADAGEAEVMDEIVVIGQAGPALGREALGALSGIMIKTTKPRVIYRPSFAQKGGPAFTFDGQVLGIGAQLVYQEKLTNDLVVIPAADVAGLVRQAMEAPLPAETAASVEKAEKGRVQELDLNHRSLAQCRDAKSGVVFNHGLH